MLFRGGRTGPSTEERTSRATVRRLALCLGAAGAALAIVAPAANAQTILNTTSVGGQTSWLETFATGGQGDDSANLLKLSILVQHPTNRSVAGIRIDDDWDGTDETSSATLRSVTTQRPNVVGGYSYTRVTFNYQLPTSNTGMSCGILSGTRRTDNRVARLRVQLDNGAQSATTNSTIKFVATSQCLGAEDYPYIYGQTQSAQSITPGQSVTFSYKGDDKDTTGQDDFDGVRWRLRNMKTGATTSPQISCPNNGDHAQKTLNVTFPDRGRWVVEANALNNDCTGSDDNPNSSYWFYLGSVDVNSPASSSPTLSLSATRPQLNGNTTITATAADGADAGDGGRVEAIEWDLDGNTSNGVNGYEAVDIASNPDSGLTSSQLQRTINTAGMSPGLHTVRARITDNGALGGADNIRRQATATTTFLVNTPPFANNQSFATETQTPLPITLDTGDANADSLTYNITDPPDNGSLGGSGQNRTYTPGVGFAGTDSFTYSVNDGFGGTDTATVTIRVDPDTTIDSGPTGTLDDRGATFEFSSRATGATFECSLDGGAFGSCSSPLEFTDLADGNHQLRVRAKAAGNTDQSPAQRSWSIDAFPALTIDSGPPAETADIDATIEFSASQQGATVDPKTGCKLDDGDFRPCSSPITYTDVDDGQHTVTVRATDAFGKQRTRTHTWTVDAVGSNTVIEVAPPPHTASTDAHLEFSSPDPEATFECKLDDGDWETCTSAVDETGLSEDTHVFRVRAVDTIGTVDPTPATARWRVDLTPPVSQIDVGPPDPGNDPTPTFEFSADEHGSTFECRIDGSAPQDWEPCDTPFTTPPLAEGNHTLDVRATDAVGNVEGDDHPSRNFEIDLTPPTTQITSGPSEGEDVASSAVTFGFESPSDLNAGFQCRLDSGNWRPCDDPTSQSYSGLADGQHVFRVRARDAAGNIDAAPAERNWNIDTTAPQTALAGGPAGTVDTGDATFELVSDDPGATFECSLDGEPFAACTSPQAYTGLADGSHEFRARAIDALGNTDATPALRTWAVDTRPRELPNQQPPAPPRKPCTFTADELPYCADPFIIARAHASGDLSLKRGFGRLSLKANGGGANLHGARFFLPKGLKLRVLEGGARLGTLQMFGLKRKSSVALSAGGRRLADGPPRVEMRANGRRLVVKELPNLVRRLRIRLKSSALVVQARECGTAEFVAKLRDRVGATARVKHKSDIRCTGGRR